MSMLSMEGAPPLVLVFLADGARADGASSALRRPLVVAALVEFRFPLLRAVGRAVPLSSDPVLLNSLMPRAELPATEALAAIRGDVLLGCCTAGAA